MPAGEHEMRFLVLGQSEGRRLVSLEIVAAVASVEVRRRGKLLRVLVGVTICATLELTLNSVSLPFGNVALRALQPRMPTLQWICLEACSFTVNSEGFHP